MSFELGKAVADAVLYEGYVLYPYRASAVKNQVRWQFGVVVPRGYADEGGSEPWAMQTECLIEPQGTPQLAVRVRFLQVQARTLERVAEDGSAEAVESLEVEGRSLVAWDEGVERAVDPPPLLLLDGVDQRITVDVAGGLDVEEWRDAAGRVAGRILRRRWALAGEVRVTVEALGPLLKVRVRLENHGAWPEGADTGREAAVRRSLVGAHTLLAVTDGAFVSLLEPPWWAAEAVRSCVNEHTWPVLVGPEGQRGEMLSSPIILYDHPAIAPESPGELCDATEIDEILTLRVMTLTDEEKREACATDERARRIVERSDAIPPEVFERLHGAMRRVPGRDTLADWEDFVNPPGSVPPERAALDVGGARVCRGSRVRLRPRRRADAMDAFLDGHVGRVEGVFADLDDRTYVAVTVEDDPAAELHASSGRFFYFDPDEIEPLEPAAAPGAGA